MSEQDEIVETEPGRFQFRPPYERVDALPLARLPQPDREMVHRGSPGDAAKHMCRTHVRIQDGQLADAYWYRKSRLEQLALALQKARDQLESEQRNYDAMQAERDAALERWQEFRRSTSKSSILVRARHTSGRPPSSEPPAPVTWCSPGSWHLDSGRLTPVHDESG